MSDLPAEENAKRTTDETESPPPPPKADGSTTINPETQSQCRKRKCCRKFHNAPKWIEAFCAVALVFITGWYTHYAGGQLRQLKNTNTLTTKALDNAKEQLRITVRPWVGPIQEAISLKASPVIFDSAGNASIRYQLAVHNSGSIPAQGVMPTADLVVTNNLQRVLEAEAIACNGNRKSDPRIGQVLFPQGIIVGEGGGFYEQSKMIIPGNSDGKVSVFMVSCTTYRDQFGCSYGTKATYRLGDPITKFGISFLPPRNRTVKGGVFILMNGALDDPTCPTEAQTK